MGHPPFEVVTELKPRAPLDLVSVPLPHKVSEGATDFCRHLEKVHQEVRSRVAYKQHLDSHRRHIEFSPGDLVLTHVSPERFPQGALTKLHSCKAGLFKILRHLGPNAYLLELLTDVHFSPMFNLEGLTAYPGDDTMTAEDTTTTMLPRTTEPQEAIEAILTDQIVSTRRGGFQKCAIW